MGNEKRDPGKITVTDIRYYNTLQILKNIVESNGIRKNELAKNNDLSIVTVNIIEKKLKEAGLIEERVGDSRLGRKPMELFVNPCFGSIVCINLSRLNKITYIIYNLQGLILKKDYVVFKDDTIGFKEKIAIAVKEIIENLKQIDLELVGVAAYVPGIYFEEDDSIKHALNDELATIKVREFLSELFAIDNILIIHDTFASAQSEYENTKDIYDSQFYLYCGDGVSGCFTYEDKLILGKDMAAGEVGKCLVYSPSAQDWVCLEDHLSIIGIRNKLKQKYQGLDIDTLLGMAASGKKDVQCVIDEAIDLATKFLYNICWIYNPSKIVIDSFSQEYAERIIESVNSYFEKMLYSQDHASINVTRAVCDEFHTMRDCRNRVLNNWMEQQVTKMEGIE